jgi:hypothetical protein
MDMGEWREGSACVRRNWPAGDYFPKIHHRNSNNRIIQWFTGCMVDICGQTTSQGPGTRA